MPGYKTVTSVDSLPAHLRSLICPQCKLLLREAVQTEDGIRLCETCYRHISRRTSGESNELIAPECKVYTDRAVRKETADVKVYCDHGCSWTGRARDLQSHFMSECPYVREQCSNEGCQEELPVCQLSDHAQKYCQYRRVTCDWCHRETTMNLLGHHMHHCPEFTSEHHQNLYVLRNHVEEYRPPAPPQVVNALVQLMSCDGPPQPLPLTLCTDQVHPVMEQGMGQPTALVVSSCRVLHPQIPDTLSRGLLHQQEAPGNLLSPPSNLQLELPFPILEQGVGQPTAKLVTGLHHPNSENADALTQRKLHQQGVQENSRTHLQDVNITDSHYSETRIMELDMRVEELFRQQTDLNKCQAELGMQLTALLAGTHNKSFLWRIPDISQRKQDAIDGLITSIYSPPFYTGRNGYKMCLKAYLNGDGSGHTTHLSLFIVLMKGEHDALLRWPFNQRVSLTLLDQTRRNHITRSFNYKPESSSFQQPSLDMNVASGFPKFVLNSVFNNKDYVCDDVMYIKCTVDTAHIY